MAKQWNVNAATAKQIAQRIVTGEEENKQGIRLVHVVYRLDTFATDALNMKYSEYGSQASIHTNPGGNQTIDTRHADGSEGHFNSNGNNTPTENAMDIEIENYMNNHLDESKKMTKKITESQLRDLIAESVKKVLNEISLSDYDNGESMSAHYANKLDGYGDEDGNYDNDRQFPDYDSDEDRWDELVHMKNRGLLTDKELEAIAEKLYY